MARTDPADTEARKIAREKIRNDPALTTDEQRAAALNESFSPNAAEQKKLDAQWKDRLEGSS